MITGIKDTGEVFIDGIRLDPKASQDVFNHSPDGFSWGYNGSGCTQLALALLLYYTNYARTSERYYQKFKEDVISHLEGDFKMNEAVISGWLQAKGLKYDTPHPKSPMIKPTNTGKIYKTKLDFVIDTKEEVNLK